MGIEVTNAAGPTVRITAPADGARLAAGAAVVVRAESRNADRLWIAVDGTRRWSGVAPALQRRWTPAPGRHRLVAVAQREGAPDAVASVDVRAVPRSSAPSPATGPGGESPEPPAAAPGAPAGGGGAPGATPGSPHPRPGLPASGGGAAPGGGPAGGAPTTGAGGGSPTVAPREAGAPGAVGEESAWRRVLRGDPEAVARALALPLLLLIAGGAYLLLQRFIDGGQALAWRGRGRPDDVVIEF